MQLATGSPNYLSRNLYGYCFRIRVPQDLQSTLSKKELRYSLKTGNLSTAKTKARYFAGQFQLFFKDIQRGRFKQMNLTKEQISKLIKEYKERLFKHYDKPVPYGQYDGKLDPETEAAAEYQWLEYTRKDLNTKRIAGDYSEIEKTADEILIKMGIASADIDKSSDEYSALLSGLLRAELKGLNRYERNLNGDFSDELEQDLTGVTILPQQPELEPVDHGPLLSKFMEKFPETKPKWDKASHSAYRTATKVILKILGDIPVGTITRALLVTYRETLSKSPAFWTNRHPDIKAEDLPVKGLPTIGKSTFDRNLIYLGELMDYAVDKEYLKYSPMPKTQISLPDDKIEVHQFSNDQVKTIITASKGFEDQRYWIPLLGLYTGCRVNELCQLHKEDLKEKDGIWYLDINDDGKKTLKNKSSKRLVPLHSAIIQLGFIEYENTVDHHRIFPGCTYTKSKGKYSNGFGKWFNKTCLVDTGIKDQGDRSITFHSFRHRAYTTLKRLEINNEHINLIMGHKLSETKNDTYHHGYELQDFKADIERIPDHRTI